MVSLSQADFGVALMLAIVAIPMQLWRFHHLHAERLKTDRYALFAVRDRWIRLVAEGRLTEDDDLFQFLYEEINDIVPTAKPLTLRNIVAALKTSRMINDETFKKKCFQLVQHHDDQVRAVMHEFIGALMNILLGRSLFVALGRKGGKKGGKARWAGVSPEERSEILRTAVQARWAKVKRTKPQSTD